jgi:cytochrome P450
MGLPGLTHNSLDTIAKKETAPGPSGSLLLGSLKEFQADSIGFLTESVRQHGDIVRFRFGYVVAYLVNRPEYVEHVLTRGSRHYDKNTRSVSKLRATCGGSLLSSDGEPWLRHRRLIQPVFQPQHVRAFVPTIDSSTQEMLESWDVKASCGEDVDIVSEMMRLTMTIAARVLFESDIRDRTEVIEQALAVILEDTWRRLETPIDTSVISPSFHRPGFRSALREIDHVVYGIIEQRRQSGDVRDDLLSRLLRAHEADDGTRLTDQELRDAVVTLLLAGHETTANALASAFYLVSQSPHAEDRLVREAKHEPFDSERSELPEARMAFSEAIRIYPSIWIIERRAVSDDQIGPYWIPKGSTVILSPYLLHRHPEFWQDPEEFDPDRFSPDRISERPRHAYIPFGLGPHRCIGEHMAALVATRILSRVHRNYRLRLNVGQAVNPVPGITLRHDGELRMTLHHVDHPSKL